MSYDLYLREVQIPCPHPCAHCRQGRAEDYFDWNYTSNMAGAWCEAGADLKTFDDRRAGDCAPILRQAIAKMRAEPERFARFEPANGWGSLRTLIPALEQLASACEAHPDAVIGVSR